MVVRLVILLSLLAVALAAAPARAATLLPPAGRIFDGVTGSTSTDAFAQDTGARPDAFGFFAMWGGGYDYIFRSIATSDAKLVLHVSTAKGQLQPAVITPLEIARGKGDGFLLHLNRRLVDYGGPVYLRLMAEMNQADNAYSGFDRDGRSRGPSRSPKAFRAAWRRSTLILRGGPLAAINARLARLRLPPVQGAPAGGALGRPNLAMMWVPQTEGSPPIHANRPRAYWPGSRYVDWVGTDFYSRYPNWSKLERFYADFRGKPFVFGEWALWGGDDPAFVRRFFAWVKAHRRVRMVLYNQGNTAGGPFRLSRHPRSRAEIRRQLRHRRFR